MTGFRNCFLQGSKNWPGCHKSSLPSRLSQQTSLIHCGTPFPGYSPDSFTTPCPCRQKQLIRVQKMKSIYHPCPSPVSHLNRGSTEAERSCSHDRARDWDFFPLNASPLKLPRKVLHPWSLPTKGTSEVGVTCQNVRHFLTARRQGGSGGRAVPGP